MENPITVKLKEQYRNIGGDDDDRQFHSRTVVGLELVVKNKGEHFLARVKNEQRHTIISHGEMFKQSKEGEQPIKRILVEGGAGMGKTTLCTSLTKGWANGKLFQKYDVLLLIPLDQKEVALATSLLQLIEALKLKVNSQEMVSYIQDRNGNEVVVIADGWNSLDESERQEGSFFHKLLFGSLLSLASVVVTSRPTASAALHKGDSVDRFLETYGFNRESMRDHVKHELADQHDSANADGLLKQMDGNPALLRMCRVPITCTKVYQLWHNSEGAFPSRITELCTKIILNILNYKRHETGISISISSMADIDDLPKHIQESWWRLCKLAFLTIEENKIDLTMFNSFQYGIMTFGFVEYNNTDEGSVSVNFVHPTSHEYLAALHIVRQPADRQLQALNAISLACRQAPILWKYYFGLCDHVSLNTLDSALQTVSTYHLPKCLLCHCAYEARNDTVTDKVIQYLHTDVGDKRFIHFGDPHNSHDCEAVLYVIASMKSSECDEIEINFRSCNTGIRLIHRLANVLASSADRNLQVKNFDVSDNSLSDEAVTHLFETATSSFQSLEKLYIRKNGIKDKGIFALVKSLSASALRSLIHLDLSFNPLTLLGLYNLDYAVKSGVLGNLKILFMQGCLTSDVHENIKYLTSFSEDILACCFHLQQLDLSINDLGEALTHDAKNCIMQLSEVVNLTVNSRYMTEIDKTSVPVVKCFFFPSALCHATEQQVIQVDFDHSPPPLLIAFDGGVCPRGIPKALISCIMNNHMSNSKVLWKLNDSEVSNKQVSFDVGPCDIIMTILSSYLEVKLSKGSRKSSNLKEISRTCTEAFKQLQSAMLSIANVYHDCDVVYDFAFNCTRLECESKPHPVRIKQHTKRLKCKRTDRESHLPQYCDMWLLPEEESQPSMFVKRKKIVGMAVYICMHSRLRLVIGMIMCCFYRVYI